MLCVCVCVCVLCVCLYVCVSEYLLYVCIRNERALIFIQINTITEEISKMKISIEQLQRNVEFLQMLVMSMKRKVSIVIIVLLHFSLYLLL